jgi:hypothetical protein
MINIESMKKSINKNIQVLIQKAKENKHYRVAGSVILVSIFAYFCFFNQGGSTKKLATTQNKRSESMLHELNDISAQLQQISQSPSESKVHGLALKEIQKNVADIQKSIAEIAKTSDIQKVSNQITSIKDDVTNQISDLKKTVSMSSGNKQFLDANALPFHVISIDVIAGQPYVSVDYDNHILPVAIGDLLAGWRVSSADYDSGVAEFENGKDQFIRINLQGAI